VIHELEEENVKYVVNATSYDECTTMSSGSHGRCHLCFTIWCRINNMGYNTCDEITKLRNILDEFEFKAKIIVGSIAKILNVIEWFGCRAHYVTVVPNILEGMITHPYTKEDSSNVLGRCR